MTKTFPTENSMLYRIIHSKGVPKDIKRFRIMNKYFMVPLMRANILQLFGVGFIFVLIRTLGRKSKKVRYTPLEYRKFNGKYYIFSSRGKRADWYRNLKGHPEEFMVKVHFFWRKPEFREIESTETKVELFKEYARKYPMAAREFFGYNKKIDDLDDCDFTELAEFVRIIEFTL